VGAFVNLTIQTKTTLNEMLINNQNISIIFQIDYPFAKYKMMLSDEILQIGYPYNFALNPNSFDDASFYTLEIRNIQEKNWVSAFLAPEFTSFDQSRLSFYIGTEKSTYTNFGCNTVDICYQ
jgi:hypothetical protein